MNNVKLSHKVGSKISMPCQYPGRLYGKRFLFLKGGGNGYSTGRFSVFPPIVIRILRLKKNFFRCRITLFHEGKAFYLCWEKCYSNRKQYFCWEISHIYNRENLYSNSGKMIFRSGILLFYNRKSHHSNRIIIIQIESTLFSNRIIIIRFEHHIILR